MWFFALFDLPVVTKQQRRVAGRFRNDLLDLGFSMVQYSVYARPCNREATDTLIARIREKLPPQGRVAMLTITDKQYGGMAMFSNMVESHPKNPLQYSLF
jgi:CRISPR-associated protein Cas2